MMFRHCEPVLGYFVESMIRNRLLVLLKVRCHASHIFGVTRVTFLKVIQLKLLNWNIEKTYKLSLCNSFSLICGVQ